MLNSTVPLLLTTEQGYGHFPARPRLVLKDGRYEVVRMLGRGRTASIFLVRDLETNGYEYFILVLAQQI